MPEAEPQDQCVPGREPWNEERDSRDLTVGSVSSIRRHLDLQFRAVRVGRRDRQFCRALYNAVGMGPGNQIESSCVRTGGCRVNFCSYPRDIRTYIHNSPVSHIARDENHRTSPWL